MPAEQGEDAWTESCSVDNVDVVGDMEASSSIAVCRLQNMRFGKAKPSERKYSQVADHQMR